MTKAEAIDWVRLEIANDPDDQCLPDEDGLVEAWTALHGLPPGKDDWVLGVAGLWSDCVNAVDLAEDDES